MASRGINKVILIGNLGADPEVRHMQNGDAVATVNLATSESWKDKNTGDTKEQTEWHRVVFFGKIADVVKQYLHKGSKIYVEGKLRTRKWQGQDGQDRYTTEVVVDINGTMQMLDSRTSGTSSTAEFDPGYASHPSSTPMPARTASPSPRQQPAPAPNDYREDDIPF